MRKYQLVMVLKPDLKREQKDKLFADVKTFIGKVSGDKEESMGEKKLSYPIKHERRAEFVVMNFEAETILDDYNKRLVNREEVLRHLLVRD